MTITAKTAQFKAKLGQYMRAVKGGKTIVIKERDTPVARLIPYTSLQPRENSLACSPKDPTAPSPGNLKVRSIPFRETHSTEELRIERNRR